MGRLPMIGSIVAAAMLIGAACTAPPDDVTATIDVGGEVVEVSVPAGLTLTVGSADLSSLPPLPPGPQFPLGAFDITVGGVTPGGITHLTLTLPSPANAVVKLIDGAWEPFTHDGTTGATLSSDGLTVSVDLADGGRGDNDGVADGTIVDPIATAVVEIDPCTDAPCNSQVTQHLGDVDSPDIAAGFTAATGSHSIELIDFDGDGFDGLSPGTFTPVPTDHYATQGVTVLGLDAVRPFDPGWTHSPPIAVWATGFNSAPIQPFSLLFAQPVASVGFFANDVESQVTVTVHMSGGGTETFTMPAQGGAAVTRFHGFTTDQNAIERIDFDSTDWYMIDDLRIGTA